MYKLKTDYKIQNKMKNILITLSFLLISVSIKAQSFSGKATYKSHRKSNFKTSDDSKMIDKHRQDFEAKLREMYEKTYILSFDKNESTYKEYVKLDAPKPQAGNQDDMVIIKPSGISALYYKNLKENRFVNQTQIMDKVFLIKDTLTNRNWELSSEKKYIGNYTCYKATFSEEVINIHMIEENGEVKEVEEKKNISTTAWYSLELPFSNGPNNYQGLPGLILEINDGTTTIVCTEIILLNTDKKITISEPKKGKVVNQEQFNKIRKQKEKEMMERHRHRGRNFLEDHDH